MLSLRTLLPLAALTLLVPLAPAQARVVDHDNFRDSGSETLDDLCGVEATHTWAVRVHFALNIRRGLPYFTDSAHGWEKFTNNATGKSFTLVYRNNIKDQRVTDNGDGTLTVLVHGAGGFKAYDDAGNRLFRDPGMTTWEILIDDGGTPSDPRDDEFLDFLGTVKESTGLNEAGDFCEDFLAATS